MVTQTTLERPNLERQPVVFNTVRESLVGALIGGGLTLASNALSKLSNNSKRLLTEVPHNSGVVAAIAGITAAVSTLHTNQERSNTRPYVERLEMELAAKNAALDNARQR